MNTTPNINLSTYTSDPNDKFNLLVTFNNNMSKIDTAVGAQNDAIDVIEETAGTAVTTANTASATAEEALTTAEGKTSINDNVASASTTYSSNKINDLIEGIEPGTEIDDSVTSTIKTWSSSKINTEISEKTSINDTTAGSNTTYSSNKIESLVGEPYDISTLSQLTNFTVNTTSAESTPILSTGFYITASTLFDQYHAQPNTNLYLYVSDTIDGNYSPVLNYPIHKLDTAVNATNTPIIYIKSGLYFKFAVQNAVVSSSGDIPRVYIYKIN